MKFLPIGLLALIIAGCDNDCHDGLANCPTPDNLHHFPWLMELIEQEGDCSGCATVTVRGTFYGETVVYTTINDPLCDFIFVGPLYDCRGNVVKTITSSEADQQILRDHLFAEETLAGCI
jgi:hypothetical protein